MSTNFRIKEEIMIAVLKNILLAIIIVLLAVLLGL